MFIILVFRFMVYDLLGQCWWNTLYSRSYLGRSMVLVDVIMGVLTEPLSGLWTCRRSRSMIWAIGEDKSMVDTSEHEYYSTK